MIFISVAAVTGMLKSNIIIVIIIGIATKVPENPLTLFDIPRIKPENKEKNIK